MATTEKEKMELPEEITQVTNTNPRDLVILSIPKMGKGTIMGALTRQANAIVLDLEKGGYDYIPARKLSTYTNDQTTIWESFQNFIKFRNALLEQKGKYEYLIIDGLSDLDALSEIGGTLAYMNSIIGKKFNRVGGVETGRKYEQYEPEWKSVLTLPEGAGYLHTRNWFMQQVEFFRQISPYRIYAAHITDKYIKDNGKETVNGVEIALTGQLKRIFASRVTSLAKLVAEDNKRYLNFEVLNDSIVAGSRAPQLKGRILISEQNPEGETITFWENIYK
jgi:hypothetical protein